MDVVFVELVVDDGPPEDDEMLAQRRRWKPPAWFARVWWAALGVVLIGGVLAADQAARHNNGSTTATAAGPTTASAPAAAGLVYADRGHCPITVTCASMSQPRIDLWASYNALFDNSTPEGGSVWYDVNHGTVYYQELDAIGDGGQMIMLVQQRLVDVGPNILFGPTIDYSPDYRHALSRMAHREAVVTMRRGAWLVTATLDGVRDARLPIAAAMRWTATSPLPE